jgi:hypothetical protein
MELNAIVALLNTGRTADDLAAATAVLGSYTVKQLKALNGHPDLICNAFGTTKRDMIRYLLGGINRGLESAAIARVR